MLPEGNRRGSKGPVALLVDATRPASRMRVFGMPLAERVLRAAQEAGLSGARVWIQEAAGAPTPLPRDLETAFDVVRGGAAEPLAKRVAELAASVPVLLVLEGDAVVDPRLLAHLARAEGSLACVAAAPEPGCGRPSAVLRLEGAPVDAPTCRDLADLAEAWVASGSLQALPPRAVPAHVKKLRRDLEAFVFRVTDEHGRARCERFLFASNYKGSTDFFTKHVYPPLVWALLQPLARRRVHPNWISGFNVLITFAAIPLFATGAWVSGLGLAYAMSVLDSVDGKLARLTYRSSKLGHVLDHGLDVVHPPLWYLGFAAGLGGGPLLVAAWWMTGFYVADRLVTEAFTRLTGGRSIHGWAPIDVRARTFVSRRNINVPIFTVGLLIGEGAPAFLLIVAWQVATLVFHAARLAAVAVELRGSARSAPRGA